MKLGDNTKSKQKKKVVPKNILQCDYYGNF